MGGRTTLIPYCRRPVNDTDDSSSIVDVGHGHDITFKQLFRDGVTVNELLSWQAPIDVVERYSIYSQFNVVHENPNQTFRNCTFPWFGIACNYKFYSLFDIEDTRHYFEELDEIRRLSTTAEIIQGTNGTQYIGRKCKRGPTPMGLDWREICDGKLDCLNGEDEFDCWLLETNECDSTEYRCSNGQCIDGSLFMDDISLDCMDGSDEAKTSRHMLVHTNVCGISETVTCSEHICPRSTFSCGDGTCISIFPPYLLDPKPKTTCHSGRIDIHTRAILTENATDRTLSRLCRMSLLCVFRLHVYANLPITNCCSPRECIDTILKHCSLYFNFPSFPVLHNHIYLLYTTINRTKLDQWFINMNPNYVCYNETLCRPTFLRSQYINGSTCIPYIDNENRTRVRELIDKIQEMFLTCTVPDQIRNFENNKCAHSTFFQCPNSSQCISKYRLLDRVNDCFDAADEQGSYSCKNNLPLRFQCPIESNKCIHLRFTFDGEPDCSNWMDERAENGELNRLRACSIYQHRYHCKFYTHQQQIFSYNQICNGIEEHSIVLNDEQRNITDEIDCRQCYTRYTRCNRIWDCQDGRDELGCSWRMWKSLYSCNHTSEHYCLLSNNTGQMNCLPVSQAGDNKIDCLGATDERHLCKKSGQGQYRCANSSKCINVKQLCDCHSDCIGSDDEYGVCPWLMNATCILGHYLCSNGNLIDQNHLCDEIFDCSNGEDERFCDLIMFERIDAYFTSNIISPYPKMKRSLESHTIPIFKPAVIVWSCNQGLVVYESNTDSIKCWCSPAYYGDRCEFQSERVSVLIRIRPLSTNKAFRLYIFLFADGIQQSFEHLLYQGTNDCSLKQLVYLLYYTRQPKPIRNVVYTVRIDAFRLDMSHDESMVPPTFVTSWFFPVPFPFLPVYQITTPPLIISSSGPSSVSCRMPCFHGYCIAYENEKGSYCRCKSGWHGIACNVSHHCDCSEDSLCIGRDSVENRSICVCPLHKYGSRCYIPNRRCFPNRCKHGGPCIPPDPRESFVDIACLCPPEYIGPLCEQFAARLTIDFSQDRMTIPQAILIHGIRTFRNGEHLPERLTLLKKIDLYEKSAIIYFYPQSQFFTDISPIPQLIFFQSLDIRADYYLLWVRNETEKIKMISTYVHPSGRCPHIRQLFNATILALHTLERVKYYHEPCQSKKDSQSSLRCFYDETQMCLCTHDHLTDCFLFDHDMIYNCDGINKCINNGECFQDAPDCPRQFYCHCPACFYGSLCQFNSHGISLSIDAILGEHIQPSLSFRQQPLIIHVSIAIVTAMFILGLTNGSICLITFVQRVSLEVGVGIYLLISTIVSIMTTCIFTINFWYLILTQMRFISLTYSGCLLIDYLLRIMPTLVDWLNACVAIERAVNATLETSFNKLRSRNAAKIILIVLCIAVSLSSLHDPLVRRLVDDETNQRRWCIASYAQHSPRLDTYDFILTTFNFAVPFGINIISAILIVVQTTRKRSNAQRQHSFKHHLVTQLHHHKYLIISPSVLVIFALPRVIISLSVGCMQSSRQPGIYLAVYFISFLPSITTFLVFVRPSKMYMQAFIAATKRYRNIVRQRFYTQ